MATRALLAALSASPPCMIRIKVSSFSSSSSSCQFQRHSRIARCFSSDTNPSILQPPDVSHLAETARISLSPSEIEECGAKICQVIDWFGQLQQVDVNSVEPAIRAEMEGGNLREDVPKTFENRESIRSSIPSFDEVNQLLQVAQKCQSTIFGKWVKGSLSSLNPTPDSNQTPSSSSHQMQQQQRTMNHPHHLQTPHGNNQEQQMLHQLLQELSENRPSVQAFSGQSGGGNIKAERNLHF